MKIQAVALMFALVLIPNVYPQSGMPPGPPGARPTSEYLPIPVIGPRTTDPVDVKRAAKELAQLVAIMPGQLEALNNGTLPKDLPANLKRMEKLAKQLRTQIEP